MKKLHIIVVAVIVIIIVAGVCFKLGFVFGRKSLEPTVAQYKKVIDYNFPVPEEMFGISGKIIDIQDKTLSIETTIQDPYVLPSEWKTKIIKATVNNETKITKFDMETGEEIKINFSDLKIENEVSAGANENIKDKAEFEAESIML